MDKPFKMPPTPQARNQEIWHQVVVLEMTQKEVADKYEIGQPRVSAIVKQVAHWRALARPGSKPDWRPAEQISYANQVTREKLQHQLGQAETNFAKSQQATKTVKVKEFVEVVGEGDAKEEKVLRFTRETTTREVPQGDFRFLGQQFKLTKELHQVALAEAQVPPPPQPPPPGTLPTMSRESVARIERLVRHWHNQQLRVEAGRIKTPLYLWPPTMAINLDWYDRPEFDERERNFYRQEQHDGTVNLSAVKDLPPPPATPSGDDRNKFGKAYDNFPKANYDPSFQFPQYGSVTTKEKSRTPPSAVQYSPPADSPPPAPPRPLTELEEAKLKGLLPSLEYFPAK